MWEGETQDSQILYDGKPLERISYLRVKAIGRGDTILNEYRLRVIPFSGREFSEDTLEILIDTSIDYFSKQILLADRFASVGVFGGDTEFWSDVVLTLSPWTHSKDVGVYTRLSTAYLHLGRLEESTKMAKAALSRTPESSRLERAEVLLLLAQGQILLNDPAGFSTLAEARLIYEDLGLSEAGIIDWALEWFAVRNINGYGLNLQSPWDKSQ